jgi:hypothetical protein
MASRFHGAPRKRTHAAEAWVSIERRPEQLLMVVVVLLIEAVVEELVGVAFEFGQSRAK